MSECMQELRFSSMFLSLVTLEDGNGLCDIYPQSSSVKRHMPQLCPYYAILKDPNVVLEGSYRLP